MNNQNDGMEAKEKEIKEVDVEMEHDGDESSSNMRVGAAIAAGALAAGAAAAGYYFYASKDADKHRKNAAKWAGSLKREVMRQMDHVKTLDRESVAAAVDRAVAVYERLRAIDTAELLRAAKELKSHWQNVSEEYQEAKKSASALRAAPRRTAKAASTKRTGSKK